MKAEVKAEWLKRLRSGEYKQTGGVLHRIVGDDDRVDTFCCLGVLCEIAVEQGVVKSFDSLPENSDREVDYGLTKSDATTGVPPQEVLVWAEVPKRQYDSGLKVHNDEFHFEVEEGSEWHTRLGDTLNQGFAGSRSDRTYSLVEMNDSGKFTFAEIADVIEQYF